MKGKAKQNSITAIPKMAIIVTTFESGDIRSVDFILPASL